MSLASASSPSVSLERGNYRMRAPRPRPPPFVLPDKGPPIVQHRVNRNLALLLLALALACMSCFASAYYLFATRWDFHPASLPYPLANPTSKANVSDTARQPEKYLAYLPHSGFHNQRIAFENALVLSRILRRTLLVPPIRLGNRPIRYVEFHTLSRHHELSGKEGLSHCPRVPVYLSRPPECLQYFESSYAPWDWLVDLSPVIAKQSLFLRPNMSLAWVRAKFNLELSDMYTLADDSPYSFRFLDTPEDGTSSNAKYLKNINIADLAAVNQSFLQLGTLFGTSRLRLRNPDNMVIHQSIRRSMILINSDLTRAADRIALSFKHTYLGLHLRLGDGPFQQKVQNTTKTTWWKVLKICELERNLLIYPTTPTCSDPVSQVPLEVPVLPNLFNGKCRFQRHTGERYQSLNIPLYIATDLKGVEVNPFLSIFPKTFPCVFFLQDFLPEIAPLERIKSPYDDVNLMPFLLPFVDSLVAGKAMGFVGTEGSTFSKFVNEILWASSHTNRIQVV
ncbi:hypothetical protein CPB84DRAFT_1835004 [Gymnopilus junonius]|uniref:O-fucosyltransferase family protein n=1 Tax=Gymnopilus junonius TaxID=109634 RepID=A0A9P5NTU2_GYMJU|nr:hypothetical protein CPB84DRAFT_1835004 [Gymnopilus junonius]